MLAADLARALDPALLPRAAGLTPDPWQADLLRSRARQMILLCSRQAGKSQTSGWLAVDEALHRPPALVLLLAPALRQSQELFRKVKETLQSLGEGAAPIVQESALSLELANGSRIVSLPGREGTIRGYSNVALLVVDEAARVPDPLYMAIRPMLAVSGGRIILLSSPFGKRGFLFREFTEGGPDWQRVRVTAHDVPRIDPAWLAAERDRIGDWWFRQEYLCEFVETDDQVFGYDQIMRAVSADVAPLFPPAVAA
ncbi:MAG: phage terminase large subunit [Gemmatimonadales bacterium]